MYAPIAMKPAWPIENCPVIPFTTFSETARMTLTPTPFASCTKNGASAVAHCTSASTGIAMRNGKMPRSPGGSFSTNANAGCNDDVDDGMDDGVDDGVDDEGGGGNEGGGDCDIFIRPRSG